MNQNIIQQEIAYDGITPIMVYQAIGNLGSCILESASEKGEGKISSIGINPIGTFKAYGNQVEIHLNGHVSHLLGDPYEILNKFVKNRKAFGFIGYNAIRVKEKIPDRHPMSRFPDFLFHIYQTVITFYHEKQRVICQHEGSQEGLEDVIQRCFKPTKLTTLEKSIKIQFKPDINQDEFINMVEKSKKYIKAGDIFQVVISRTFHTEIRSKPFDIYRAMRQISPSPYHFFFEEENFVIVGASPELLISVRNGEVESLPIAGTSPIDKEGSELLECSKECAEHVMLVDLARNDIGVIAEAGTVQVADYKVVKQFSHVNHLVSRVKGKLKSSFHALDAFKASFPAGTLSGAPKIRAMEIIDELELTRRELYGGAIVSIDENGDLMSCIAIRTALIKGSKLEVRVGAGIVLDSNGEKEAQETMHKVKSVLEAIELAEGSVL